MSRTASLRSAPAIAIVGAGVVGAAIALALTRRGAHVTLLDRAEPGRGCSYGNAGALSPGSVAPLALPGLVKSLPRLLLDPESPLHLPPAYAMRALPWLLRFVAAARPERVEAIAQRLAALNADAIEHHVELARDVGAAELIQRTGQLHVYPDAGALAKDAFAWTLRARHGVRFERLDRAGIEALEPGLAPRYTVGIFVRDAAVVINPFRYVQQIVRSFVVRGGRLVRDQVRAIEPDLPRGWTVVTGEGRQNVDHVVVAAGVHSGALVAPLGVRLPIESQRGYHVTFRGVPSPVARAVVLADRKAFVTPMEQGFRVAGTVEFGGLARPANPRRSALLARFAREAFTGVAAAEESHWMGHRPCTPESLPLIGPVATRHGLWVATGHGHLGLTQAVNTARLLADAILEGAPALASGITSRADAEGR